MTSLKRVLVALSLFATMSTCKLKSKNIDSGLAGSDDSTAVAYQGHANYRLLLVGNSGPDFDPNQDLMKPNQKEKDLDSAGSALKSAALKSLVPIMGQVRGEPSGTETDLMSSLLALADSARNCLKDELSPLLSGSSSQFPIVSEAWLIPWTEPRTEIFYDGAKISLSATEAANVLKALPGSDGFNKKLTDNVQTLRAKFRKEGKAPVFLLAARHFLFIAPGKTRLTIRMLIGLQPYSGDFKKDDPKVKFSKVVVPDIPGKGITAAITFDIPIEEKEAPTVSMAFGDYKGLEKGNFVMEDSDVAKAAPRLEGNANKPGTGLIALNFAFKNLALNLRTVQVDKISTLVSPGLALGKARWTVGGIQAQSVDQIFQKEINNTIDPSIKGAITGANDTILDGMLSKDTIELAFSKIFNRI
jgi:hypothetical protein